MIPGYPVAAAARRVNELEAAGHKRALEVKK